MCISSGKPFLRVLVYFPHMKKTPSSSKIPAKAGNARESSLGEAMHSNGMADEFGWRVFRIMSEFVEGFEFLRRLENTVTFFGSARFDENEHHYKEAQRLGKMLGEAGYTIVTGGGPGIMEAGNRGAFEAGAPSVGLNIQLAMEQRINPYVKSSTAFHYFFTRKVMLSYSAQAYVFFPGGFGTLDELGEMLVLVQTKKIEPLPIILVGRDYWKSFLKWVRMNMLQQHKTINQEDLDIIHLAKDVDDAYEIILRTRKCAQSDRTCWYNLPGLHTGHETGFPKEKKKGGSDGKK